MKMNFLGDRHTTEEVKKKNKQTNAKKIKAFCVHKN